MVSVEQPFFLSLLKLDNSKLSLVVKITILVVLVVKITEEEDFGGFPLIDQLHVMSVSPYQNKILTHEHYFLYFTSVHLQTIIIIFQSL